MPVVKPDSSETRLMHASLVVVWLGTAFVSLVELRGQSLQLLGMAGIKTQPLADLLTLAGAGTDLVLGLALWFRPTRGTYIAALGAMLAMTALATALLPALWLHPLGPLLKNLPIAAMLLFLARRPM